MPHGSGGSRTLSISRSKREWSAGCLPSRVRVPGVGIEPAASTFRAWRCYQQQPPRNCPPDAPLLDPNPAASTGRSSLLRSQDVFFRPRCALHLRDAGIQRSVRAEPVGFLKAERLSWESDSLQRRGRVRERDSNPSSRSRAGEAATCRLPGRSRSVSAGCSPRFGRRRLACRSGRASR